jgi:hypothetical protein
MMLQEKTQETINIAHTVSIVLQFFPSTLKIFAEVKSPLLIPSCTELYRYTVPTSSWLNCHFYPAKAIFV